MFIVIDGMDGCGKSLMVKKLGGFLREKGYDVLETFEPTNGIYGKKAREILRKGENPEENSELCLELFTKDRKEHLKDIKAFLRKEKSVVICDRYYYSTIAYQYTQGLDWHRVLLANKGFLKPSIAFILYLDVNVALDRMEVRGGVREKFEKREFMEKLKVNFFELSNHLDDNLVYIDASGTKEEVFDQIREKVRLNECS